MDSIRRTVDIYGREILVTFKDGIAGDNVGRSNYSFGIIEIQEGEKEHEYRTMLHEMVHLAKIDNGMGYLFDHEHTEAMCDFVQHFISQIYEKNRDTIEEVRAGRPLSKKIKRK